jgi:type II secretory pathway component PulF
MPNPYQAPRSIPPVGATLPVARRTPVLSLFFTVLAAFLATLVVPSFRDALSGYGAPLPALTRVVFASYLGLWLLPALVLAAWRWLPGPVLGPRVATAVGVGGLVLLVPLLVIGLYLPIFSLASAVR